ncbi:MAG: hypothetical protein WCR51_04570 [Planctomycetia bacterium]
MLRSRKQLVLACVACAAILAQVAPQASCRACDQPCCAALDGGRGSAPPNSSCQPAATCPLCTAAVDLRPTETSERPCHCQLTARHEQPLSLSGGAAPVLSDGHATLSPVAIPPRVPQVLGVSREYLAASLAMPIRPPRILFGVWRN